MGVSKAVLGEPSIARAMIQGEVKFIADSHIENIQKMKAAGITTRFVLLRTPLSHAASVVKNADISLNTEIRTLERLSHYSRIYKKMHRVIIMVEMGDLREGVMPCDLSKFIRRASRLPYIKIIGIGCNLACYGGIKPDTKNMNELSELAKAIENEFQINLKIISGGNSANYDWYNSTENIGNINNLRLGESILLGCETSNRTAIPGLHTHAFKLVAEVIESKKKPSLPFGEICQDAFGGVRHFEDKGFRQRVIVALGRQDIRATGLKKDEKMKIIGYSSDHLIVDCEDSLLHVGDEVAFNLNYGGLLSAMTSPFVQKQFI